MKNLLIHFLDWVDEIRERHPEDADQEAVEFVDTYLAFSDDKYIREAKEEIAEIVCQNILKGENNLDSASAKQLEDTLFLIKKFTQTSGGI